MLSYNNKLLMILTHLNINDEDMPGNPIGALALLLITVGPVEINYYQ